MAERRPGARAARVAPVRCAVYTRKSSDEGLEQAFNSLDAQREACMAYIASQKPEGWLALPTGYDDGGVSGATLARPALQRLLADIEARRVDVIIVYKVDRLTWALSDFARLIEIFDRHAVSFISVTQPFNTTTSMGRLTLHVLLSFAQFERELTGERIRDKIAASKQKGLWMGGQPPLGYDVQARRLIVNAREAETVRSIFRRYCELGSVRALRRRLLADGVTSKRRGRHDGHVTGGHPLHRGALYYLLRNRLYRGEIVHQDTSCPGQHEAIVDAALWDQVQARLAAHTNGTRRAGPRQPSLLTGLVVDAEGEGLTPSHAVKSGRRYRYYVSRHLITEGQRPDRRGWRLPAADLERLVVARLRAWLGTAAAVTALLKGDPRDAAASATLITHATRLATHWPHLAPAAATTYLHACIRRVVIRPDRLTLEIDGAQALETLLANPERVPLKTPRRDHAPSGRPITLDIPAVLTRAGLSMRLVVPGARLDTHADPCLIRLLWRAFTIHDRLTQPPALTLPQIAAAEQVPRGIRFPTRWCRRPQLLHNAPVNSRVHPKYKTRYRVGNWPAYERALVQRGDVTLWLSPDAVAAWTPGLSGRPGGPRKFSDHAIETALTLRLVFRLPLRQTEGFLRSVLTLMATGLDAPDHTTLSRRGQPLDVALDRVPTHGPVDLVVDSTGLSVFGEGEWAAAKHGGRGKRGWKKLHLGVDRSGVIVAQALTAPTSDDATTGVRFVETVPGDVASVTADTAYDTVAFYAAASARDARVVVPPARTASLSRHGPRSRARDRTIRRVQILGCRRWKKASRYPRQARVENVVFRYKSIIGPGLRARTEAGRQTEALLACDVLNRMTELGRPASYRIGR